MTKLSPRLAAHLAQMAIKQARILRTEGLVLEARQLAEYGLTLACTSAQVSAPRLVPVIARG